MAGQRQALVLLGAGPVRDAVVAGLAEVGLTVPPQAGTDRPHLAVLGALVVGVPTPDHRPFVGGDVTGWYADVHDALSRTFRVVRDAVPALRRGALEDPEAGARLVVLGTGWAATDGGAGTAAAAVHGGVVALVKTLARDLGPAGISVNEVVLDPVDPPAARTVAAAVSYLAGPTGGAMVGQLLALGRGGELRP